MGRTVTLPDWNDVASFLLICIVVGVIVFAPIGAGYLIWLMMSPVGFWQIAVALIIELIIVIVLYFVELAVIVILVN